MLCVLEMLCLLGALCSDSSPVVFIQERYSAGRDGWSSCRAIVQVMYIITMKLERSNKICSVKWQGFAPFRARLWSLISKITLIHGYFRFSERSRKDLFQKCNCTSYSHVIMRLVCHAQMDLHLHIFARRLKPDRKCTTATLGIGTAYIYHSVSLI